MKTLALMKRAKHVPDGVDRVAKAFCRIEVRPWSQEQIIPIELSGEIVVAVTV